MKQKLALLTAVLLLLSACQPAEPTAAPSAGSQSNSAGSQNSSAVSEEEEADRESPSGTTIVPSSQTPLQDLPKPEVLPASEADALRLPDKLYTSSSGYSLELLTPAQYDIEIPQDQGEYRGFIPGDIFKVSRGDKTALFNPNGKQITDFIYGNDPLWNADGGIVIMRKDGKTGGVSVADGSVIIPFAYTSIQAMADGAYFSAYQDGGLAAILDRQGKVKYTMERGDTFEQVDGELDVLVQNGTLKLIRTDDGLPVKNVACDKARVVSAPDLPGTNEEILIAARMGSKWALLDGSGNFLTDTVYDDLGSIYAGDYIEMTRNGKRGVLSYKGEVVVKPEWDDLMLSPNAASVCKDRKWGAITDLDTGKVNIQPFYDFIGRFDENGNAEAARNDKYGIIDKEGNQVVMLNQSSRIYPGGNFEDGVFLVEANNGPFSAGVMAGGKLVIPTSYYVYGQGANPVYEEDEPYNLVSAPNGKFGYIDRQGQFVIDAKFDEAEGFLTDKEIAVVKLNGKICLIDRQGNVLLETVFDDCGGFNPETMVFAMRYTDGAGNAKSCLVKLNKN